MANKGKNKAKCERYKRLNKRNTNKRLKLEKHLKKHPDDENAKKTLKGIEK